MKYTVFATWGVLFTDCNTLVIFLNSLSFLIQNWDRWVCIKWYLQLIKLINQTDHIWGGSFHDLNLHLPYNAALCCISMQYALLDRVIQGDLSIVWLACILEPNKTTVAGSPRWRMHAWTCGFDGVNQTSHWGKTVVVQVLDDQCSLWRKPAFTTLMSCDFFGGWNITEQKRNNHLSHCSNPSLNWLSKLLKTVITSTHNQIFITDNRCCCGN